MGSESASHPEMTHSFYNKPLKTAQHVLSGLFQLQQMLPFSKSVSATLQERQEISAIPGLVLLKNVLTSAEEADLLMAIDGTSAHSDADGVHSAWEVSLKRRVQQWGYQYAYDSPGTLRPAPPVPAWARDLLRKCTDLGLACDPAPEQVIVNEYLPGQGIGAHVDHEGCFLGYVLAVSLGSGCIVQFTHKESGKSVPVYIPRRSAYKMEGEARYAWTHAIAPRKTDVYDGLSIPRSRRVSITFRPIRHTPCQL